MKFKSLFGATVATVALVSSIGSAAAAQTSGATPVVGSPLNILVTGAVDITGLSSLTGPAFAANTANQHTPLASVTQTSSLQPATFSAGLVGPLAGPESFAPRFPVQHVGTGSYVARASGGPTGLAHTQAVALLGSSSNSPVVPAPETLAMLLAGLGMMGSIAIRRNK